jgi:hypothetical protein
MAIFIKKRFSLTTNIDYTNGGTVTRNPDSSAYDCGTNIQVSINPQKCFSFVKWTGDTNSNNKSLSIYLDRSKNFLANMAQIKFNFLDLKNNFPNIVLHFEVDSILKDNSINRINNIAIQTLKLFDKDSCSTKYDAITRFVLLPQSDSSYKIVYNLANCYSNKCTASRVVKLAFDRGDCADEQIKNYNINLNSGCDSCDRLVKRKDASKLMKLYPNHPNPFNPETKIRYSINKPSFVTIKIYDMLGREIIMLVNEFQLEGEYEVTFIPSGFPSGVYFYQMSADTFMDIKKMLYLK